MMAYPLSAGSLYLLRYFALLSSACYFAAAVFGTEVGVGWIDTVVLVAAVSVAGFGQHGAEFVSAASNPLAVILSYQPFQAYRMWQNQANPDLGLS